MAHTSSSMLTPSGESLSLCFFEMYNLENVRVGDKLFVKNRNYDGVVTVERITATLVITKLYRFNKKTGIAQGSDSWSSTWARPATDDDIAQAYRKKLIRKCEDLSFELLTVEQMENILKIANSNK